MVTNFEKLNIRNMCTLVTMGSKGMELSHCSVNGGSEVVGRRYVACGKVLPEMVLRALNTSTCEHFKICHTQDVVALKFVFFLFCIGFI